MFTASTEELSVFRHLTVQAPEARYLALLDIVRQRNVMGDIMLGDSTLTD